ncbi:hypothetical protein [Erythrobacter mangrovi]|uniref:Uncharacterized protein n=1 Tax=Erythrobacter mangrovi TaxID=2739433 RepID=A0A7D3XIC9_9SPHN|nr:hypothetical protein [Erythrobacter mangrovi]QKG71718.1 hypothetical protein HQR01_10265 [Erythrobacter mangrovi]
MTDHPSTFRAKDCNRGGIQWDGRATLHGEGNGGGLLDGAKGLRNGSFAELIHLVMLMSPTERRRYYIEKLGDRGFHAAEIEALSSRDDFPIS